MYEVEENMSGSSTNKELKCNKGPGSWNSYESQVEQHLSQVSDKENLTKKLLRMACCVLGAYGDDPRGGGGCDLLYYVVGSILHRNLTNKGSFDSIMEEVHKILGEALSNGNCKDLPSKGGTKLFELMEKLSYYRVDPKNVWTEKVSSKEVSCEGCTNYLKKVATALGKVKEYCAESQNKDECTGIPEEEGDQGSPGYLLGLMYGIIPDLEATLEAEREQEQCLKHLPSNLRYRSLLNVIKKCNDEHMSGKEGIKTAMENSLKQYQGTPYYADQIINTWCYANGLGESTLSGGEHCRYFYFWLGGILSSVRGEVQNFSSLMKAIYDELAKFGINDGCTNIYEQDSIDNIDIFNNMKLIYDYSKDHGTIKQYVENPQGAGFSCAKHYSSYLDIVISAYNDMNSRCSGGNGKQWCAAYRDMLDQRSEEELLKLRSSLKNISPPSTTNSATAVTTGSAVGGTLFTLGLPLAAFLSYKYDLLPSGIRKFFLRGGSGTRMRRSAFEPNSGTEMGNFTEYYTENGSTTIDPTEYSTVAGSSSNLTTTSTEDSSILYNEDGPSRSPPSPPLPRKKRGGGNNRRGQNISYHSMER
ncbi:KIR protein [Plasmodium knowlesi strain H]|uniref:PIR protein n=3 Tax=Plasmodium knowlesi TaxID=5850 RepID=A0A1A7VQE9_PLAKH|nr:KIR protein [Plasmodium knowlesi strain H]OTN68587.1 PIR protein [Plasmodium knowlesi]CAA9986559.1 KIR protein [Plasmodium knowlesi strain H]SBO24171.1 KIR protein [Plasmodium knowlesi strain H]SBO29805.1 KIR protein [Plasmodium knowlesi strain H]VVS76033.1 KIR protein [Plasmodium knowlesi strain H]